MGIFSNIFKKNNSIADLNQIEIIRRQITIMSESVSLVNDSNNLDIVIHRYDMLCNTLQKLTSYTNAELQKAGYQLKESLADTLETIQKNKNIIFNQAIERNITHELALLHTKREKLNKLEILYRKFECLPDLSGDNIQFLKHIYSDIKNNLSEEPTDYDIDSMITDIEIEYVELSTAGDESVCPMCEQFEGKIFLAANAPKLPLCPSCGCAYLYHFKDDLPSNAIISNKDDFVLPAECTPMFYEIQRKIYKETDSCERIRLCECALEKLHEFMEPYVSAEFPAPEELACRDLLPDLYMQLGEWKKAENTIKKCIDAKAYYPEDGSNALVNFKSYQKVAIESLSYITQNPGCLQRNIYKAMGYEGEDKEYLKSFLRNSKLINKIKYNNTNQLFKAEDNVDKS